MTFKSCWFLSFTFYLWNTIKQKVMPQSALLREQAYTTALVWRSPPLINPGINQTLPAPRGERDESGGETEIMLMSRQGSPPLWPFQKLLILLVVSGLEIITSSNPCNTAWPAVEPGEFEVVEAGWRACSERKSKQEGWECVCLCVCLRRVTNYQALSPATRWMISCSLQLWPLRLSTLI